MKQWILPLSCMGILGFTLAASANHTPTHISTYRASVATETINTYGQDPTPSVVKGGKSQAKAVEFSLDSGPGTQLNLAGSPQQSQLISATKSVPANNKKRPN